MYVYVRSEPQLYTVGFYDPSGRWHPDSDYNNHEDAAERAHFLNGGYFAGEHHALQARVGKLEEVNRTQFEVMSVLEKRLNELETKLETVERYSTSHRHYGDVAGG